MPTRPGHRPKQASRSVTGVGITRRWAYPSGCPRRPTHDQRHAHATWLLAGGSDLASVMDRLGHAHIQTTEKYLHAPTDADQKNLSALARIRNNTPAPPPEPAGE
jgi:integrase